MHSKGSNHQSEETTNRREKKKILANYVSDGINIEDT